MRRIALAAALALCITPAWAEMKADPVEWTLDGKDYEGVLVYDGVNAIARPGLVMVPNWMGVTPAAVETARKIAGDDYVVLVADVYGAGVRPKNSEEAGKIAGELRGDRGELRARVAKAVDVLKAQVDSAPVDAERVGALGFCFGGTAAMELVRGGNELAGVVSLHGGLETPAPAARNSARTPVLVLNGADDRGITDAHIDAFESEMDAAGADWQFVNFSGAAHCFAEPEAGDNPESNCRYDARAAKRAYRMLHGFFKERFGQVE